MSSLALQRTDLASSFPYGLGGGLTKILNGWVHLRHAHHVRDGTLRSDDATKRVGILFTELLKQYQSKLVEELVLTTLFDDDCKAGCEICCLLTDFGALVVQTPQDRGDNLSEIRFDANTYITILVVGRPEMIKRTHRER